MSKLEELIQRYCPDGVEYVRLGNCIKSLNTGLNPRQFFKLNTDDATNYYVTIKEMHHNTVVFNEGTDKINDEALRLCNNRSNLEKGDILFSGTGTIGEVAALEETPKNWNIKEGVYSIKPIPSIINHRYLMYLLQSSSIKQEYLKKAAGGTVKSVPMGEMRKLEIPLPPLPIQEEIVRILDTFTELQAELQAELQKRLQQYNYYRDNLLSFEGRTDVEWKKLGDVCSKTDNIKWKLAKETYQYIDLTSLDIQTHSILSTMEIDSSSAPSRAQQIVKENDVIFATTRPTQMRVCLVPAEYDGQICSTGYCVLRPNSSIILPQYLFFVLAVDSFKCYLLNNQTMGNYPSISNNLLKEYCIPIPSISEQKQIIDILGRFETLSNDLTAGLPAEIEKRKQQYEFYRDKLLTFKRAN